MVRLYTFPFKRTDFLAWQVRCLAAFCRDPYDLVVINGGASPEEVRAVEAAACDLGLKHVEVPEKHHENPSGACAYSIDWTIQNLIVPDQEADISVIMDFDMFLAASFSFAEFLGQAELAGLPQRRGPVHYVWPGVFMINHRTIRDLPQVAFHCTGCLGVCPQVSQPDWENGKILGQGVDPGGAMYFYFKAHPGCQWKALYSTHHITPQRKNMHALPAEFLPHYDPEFCFELLNQTFLHYGSGSNWKGQSAAYHQRKMAALEDLLTGLTGGDYCLPDLPPTGAYVDPGFHYSQYGDVLRAAMRRLRRR